jgi:hypothetical protein
VKVTWQISDGYAGGARHHSVDIPDEEITECESIEDAMGLITDLVQDDFADKVSPHFNHASVQLEVEALFSKTGQR